MPEQTPPQDSSSAPATLRRSTLLLTNAGKLLGLAIAVNELLIRPTLRESALAFAGALIFGVQTVENIILGAIDRMFDQR